MANATIEQLNFELLIDDKKFNTQVQKALQDAQALNTQLSTLLNLRRQFAQSAKGAAADERDLSKAIRQQTQDIKDNTKSIQAGTTAARAYNTERRKMRSFSMSDSFAGSKASLSELTGLAAQYVSIIGGAKLVKAITQVTSEFELQRTTLRAILQDIEGADAIFSQIKSLAVMSPFSFKELVTYAKQLSAYSIPMAELYETTKMLADVSAGLGVGMDRLVLAYGQIRSASFLRGQEVRQLTEAGIPILEELRKQFVELGEEGITVGDVFDKISNRMVPFEMVSKVFKNMTSEGGKFYQMQEIQAETLRGKISNLKDAYDIMFDKMGSKNMGMLKGAVDWVRSLAENYQRTGRWLAELVVTYGTYRTALAFVALAEKAVAAGGSAGLISRIIRTSQLMKSMTGHTHAFAVALRAVSSAAMKTALVGVASAFALIATWIIKGVQNAKELESTLNKTVNEKFGGASKLVSDFERLEERLEGAKQGSQDYRDAISELNRKYGEYMPQLASEIDSLEVLKGKINGVTDAIYNRAKAYSYEEGIKAIEEKSQKETEIPLSQITNSLRSLGKSDELISAFLSKFREAVVADMGKRTGNTIFEELAKSFFGESDRVYKAAQQIDFNSVNRLANAYLRAEKRVKDFKVANDARFANSEYDSEEEMRRIKAISDRYDGLKKAVSAATYSIEEYDEAIKKIEIGKLTQMAKVYDEMGRADKAGEVKKRIEELKGVVTGWRALVNGAVGKSGNQDLRATEGQNVNDYIDGLQKEYKNLADQYKQAANIVTTLKNRVGSDPLVTEKDVKSAQDYADKLRERKRIIEEIARVLPFTLETSVNRTGANGKTAEQTQLETRINTLKDLYSWYQKFSEAGMDESRIKFIFASLFPDESDVIYGNKYKEVLLELANTLEKYGESAKKSAQGLKDDLSGNVLRGILDEFNTLQKASEEYASFMESWIEGGDLFGTGVSFDVTRIVGNYQKKLKEINKKENEAREKLYAREKARGQGQNYGIGFSQDYNEISRLAAKEISNAMAQAQDGISNLADAWIKEWAKINGIPLEDWSQLTVHQLRKVKEALESFYDENDTLKEDMLPAPIKALKDEYPNLYEQFIQSLNSSLSGTEAKLDRVASKEKVKMLKETVTSILSLTDSLEELAAASKNDAFGDVAEALSGIASTAKDAAQGFSSGGWIGMAVAIVVDLAKEIITCITYAEALKNSIATANVNALVAKWDAALNSSSGLFGDNTLKRLVAAQEAMSGIRNELTLLYGQLAGQEVNGYFANSWLMPLTTLENTLYNIIAGKSKDLQAYQAAIEKGYTGLESYIVKSVDYSGFANFIGVRDEFNNLKDMIEGLGYEMYDVYGNLNSEALQAIIDTYDKLGAADKEWMESAIKYAEEYKKAMEELDSVISEQISGMVTSLVDEMYDSFVQCGDAAANVGDAIGDWETQLYKSILASQIMADFEDSFGDRIREMYKKLSTGINIDSEIAQLDRDLEQSVKEWAAFSNKYWASLSDLGAMNNAAGNSLASGITSITEDTANLLAAYINAMRSDLAGHRAEVQGISADVKAILGLLPSAPTLTEYLTQIQANTYNTAANTAEILGRLDSVIGDGASSFVRIQ